MTPTKKPAPSGADAEALLASLAGVLSAHVVTAPDGRIVEIHILAAAELHPKQVVRNVESALSAGFGIEVDRRIVSVAQVRTSSPDAGGNGRMRPAGDAGGDAPITAESVHPDAGDAGDRADPGPDRRPALDRIGSEPPPARRLEFVRYEARRQDETCTCEVVLRGEDDEVSGSGTGNNTAGGRAEAAARAVVDGIRKARPGLRLELDGASISSSRGRSFVIVAAHILLNRENIRLAGAAPLTRSPEEAAILAALQATNRWSG
jgi:hypothetical protein